MKDNKLFSIEDPEEESDQKIRDIKESKFRNKEDLTEEEILDDVQRQYKGRRRNLYPNSLGVTGQAFNTGKIVYSNNIAEMKDFLDCIDNVSGTVQRVR